MKSGPKFIPQYCSGVQLNLPFVWFTFAELCSSECEIIYFEDELENIPSERMI